MNEFYKRALELKGQIIEWRRHLHMNPELGMEIPQTVEYISVALKEMGYSPEFLGGGVVAVLTGSLPGKTFMLRADVDALPIQEESGLPFASKMPGVAHACGHDNHGAILLGAAKILMEHKEELKGAVKLMFQPGEETGQGCLSMLEAGLLENPKVDACMVMHSMVNTNEPSGRLAIANGPANASTDSFHVEVTGKGTHGSRPESGINPINILCHIHGLLQTINSYEKPQRESLVLVVCQINAGLTPSIIPDRATMSGAIRTYNNNVREFAKRRLTEIVEGTAKTMGGEGRVTFSNSFPPKINDSELTPKLRRYMEELLGADQVFTMEGRMSSDDFGYVMAKIPGTKMWLSMGSKAEGYTTDVHNSKVVFNEESFPVGAAAYAYGAFRWLAEHGG